MADNNAGLEPKGTAVLLADLIYETNSIRRTQHVDDPAKLSWNNFTQNTEVARTYIETILANGPLPEPFSQASSDLGEVNSLLTDSQNGPIVDIAEFKLELAKHRLRRIVVDAVLSVASRPGTTADDLELVQTLTSRALGVDAKAGNHWKHFVALTSGLDANPELSASAIKIENAGLVALDADWEALPPNSLSKGFREQIATGPRLGPGDAVTVAAGLAQSSSARPSRTTPAKL